ncbi:MAG: nuclear transport factor 2 family protein [Phycisphaerales bacterium JB040]
MQRTRKARTSTIATAAGASALLAGLALAHRAEQRAADEAAIEGAISDYIGSFYESKPERFVRGVHPNLKKRDVRAMPDGTQFLNEMTYSQLLAMAPSANRGQWTSDSRQDIEIYDIQQGIASAKLTVDAWIDYFHLAEINGEWKIVNVLWATTPPPAEPEG